MLKGRSVSQKLLRLQLETCSEATAELWIKVRRKGPRERRKADGFKWLSSSQRPPEATSNLMYIVLASVGRNCKRYS